MKAIILCGGRGTRAYPATAELPKPMLEVAGKPILQRIMDVYSHHGVQDVVLAVGYLGGIIKEWAQDFPNIEVVETGDDTDTGDRILACRDYVDQHFHVTYGDGLGDINIQALQRQFEDQYGRATITTVPLPSQYGTIEFGSPSDAVPYDVVVGFKEKPVLRDYWINAGFFMFDSDVFNYWKGSNLEREVLPRLCEEGELHAYRHTGFWKSMDTQKDQQELDRLIREGAIPWMR